MRITGDPRRVVNGLKTERESDRLLGGSYAGGRFGIIRPGLPQDLSKFW